MQDIFTNIFSELIFISAVSLYFLLTNKAELLAKLGYIKIYMDIPYDPENNLVLVVKVRLSDFKEGIYAFPQKRAISCEEASTKNAEELGLGRNLYNAKKSLKFIDASKNSKKSYRPCYVKVSKPALIKAAKNGKIPWTYNEKTKNFKIDSVEYTSAVLLTPKKALDLLIENTKKGTRPNPKKAEVYKKALQKLSELKQY